MKFHEILWNSMKLFDFDCFFMKVLWIHRFYSENVEKLLKILWIQVFEFVNEEKQQKITKNNEINVFC